MSFCLQKRTNDSHLPTRLCLDCQVAPALFMTRWQVTAVHGTPRSQRFYGTADESSFVREHQCGCLDTLSTVRCNGFPCFSTIKSA